MDHLEEVIDFEMVCTKPIRLSTKEILRKFPEGLEVPCGKCLACRTKKRQEWSTRMIHELSNHKDSVFITLTYQGEEYEQGSLCKSDLQKFFKRLRKNITPKKIRYFACGEYGDKTQRPHYHSIIFGLSLRDEDKTIITETWGRGNVDFGIAEPASIAYTAQYIDKKLSGINGFEEYEAQNREPVFRISSLGLGLAFCLSNKTQIEQQGYITINGIKQSIPRYYLKKLGIDPDTFSDKAYITECDTVAHYSGYDYSRDEAYRILAPDEIIKLEEGIKTAKLQHEQNLKARIDLKTKKL